MDIHSIGGGIHLTVEHTRRASEETLFRSLRDRLLRMTRAGWWKVHITQPDITYNL